MGVLAATSVLAFATIATAQGPQVIPGYDLRPSHCARVGHIGRSVYLPWGTIVCGQIGVIGQNECRYIECTYVNLVRPRAQVVDVGVLRVISVPCTWGAHRAIVYLRADALRLHP